MLPITCLACWLPQATRATVVLDQIGDLSLFDSSLLPPPTPSQIFTDFPDFNCTVLEDFTVTSFELRIDRVAVVIKALGGFEMFQEIEGFQVNFFTDVGLAASTLTGDAASVVVSPGPGVLVTQVPDAGGADGYGLVSLDMDVLLPAAGTYWVGVSPIAANTVAGQFFVQTSTTGTTGDANARLANPGLGLGAGALSTPGNHYAYAVTAVPETAVLSFWFLASGWWLTRRRRRAPSAGIPSKP